MKIAFLLGNFPSLSETFILNQITGLIDQGHNIKIFANNKVMNDELHDDINKYSLLEKTHYANMPVNKFYRIIIGFYLILKYIFFYPLPILKSLNFIKYKKISSSLLLLYTVVNFINVDIDKDFDIIHCHFGNNGILGLILKDFNLISGKLITTFHGSDVTSNYENKKEEYQIIFKKSNICTVNSDFLKEKVIGLGCDKDKIVKLPVGVDMNFFKPNIKYNDRKMEKIKILTVARLVEYKGLEYSIRAIHKIIKKYSDKNIEYYIVGDGKQKQKLKNLINKLDLKETIKIEGGKKREEVKKYYEKCDVFILPSISFKDGREEAQGLVLQEAQAMELPVITTNIGGIPEGVINNKTGFIVEDKNTNQIADKIDFFIKKPKEIKKMGTEGRKYVKENFNQSKLNHKLEIIYNNLL